MKDRGSHLPLILEPTEVTAIKRSADGGARHGLLRGFLDGPTTSAFHARLIQDLSRDCYSLAHTSDTDAHLVHQVLVFVLFVSLLEDLGRNFDQKTFQFTLVPLVEHLLNNKIGMMILPAANRLTAASSSLDKCPTFLRMS